MIDWADGLLRPLYLFLRFLLWLGWDMLLLGVGWAIGWPLCRLLSLGRMPSVGFRQAHDASLTEQVFVGALGFAALAATLWGVLHVLQ